MAHSETDRSPIHFEYCSRLHTMAGENIVDLDKLLSGHIGETKSIVDTKMSRLTGPGENYGSILLKVDITLQNKKDKSVEELHAVAKLIPDDEFAQKMFQIQISCKVEIAFYDTIVPTLQRFQKERGVQQVMDFFPTMYASRINLNGSDIVDENAVLLLQNLIAAGYKNVSRFESFDLATTELVLKDLAAFHAVPLALKLLEPETFQSKIQPYLIDHVPPQPSEENGGKKFTDSFEMLFDIFETDEECKPLIPQLRKKIEFLMKPYRKEPFVSLSHGDFWINNTMVKFEDGKPVSNKIVDFQSPRYLSPAKDLFFFLWTSVKLEVLDQHFDDLVVLYHENFIKYLKEVECDSSAFTLDGLLEELKSVVDSELMHVVSFTVFVIFSDKNKSGPLKHPHEMEPEDITETAKQRVIYFVKTCKRKGWL